MWLPILFNHGWKPAGRVLFLIAAGSFASPMKRKKQLVGKPDLFARSLVTMTMQVKITLLVKAWSEREAGYSSLSPTFDFGLVFSRGGRPAFLRSLHEIARWCPSSAREDSEAAIGTFNKHSLEGRNGEGRVSTGL